MPQLEFETFLPQLVWLAITFGFIYLIMAKSALPRVGEILEERQNRLDGDLEQAESYKAESKKLEADYDQLTAKARAEAQAHLKAKREQLNAVLDEKRSIMSAKMDKKFAEAEANIIRARNETLGDLEKIAADACISIVAKLSGHKISATNARKVVKASLQGRT